MKNQKPTKKAIKIVHIDLWINSLAKDAEWERYEALYYTFSQFLFHEKIGTWDGRETSFGETGKVFLKRCNYFGVYESSKTKALAELKRMITNFRLQRFTKVEVSEPFTSKLDYKKEINQPKLTWVTYR